MGAGAAGSLTGAAELFRFWVFPDCTFLDISMCSRKHFDENAHSCVIEPKYFPVPMVKGIFPQKASMQRITGKQDLENEVTV